MKTMTMTMTVPEKIDLRDLFGLQDSILHAIEDATNSSIVARGNEVSISAARGDLERATWIFEQLIAQLEEGSAIDERQLGLIVAGSNMAKPQSFQGLASDILLTYRGRAIHPMTGGQKYYIDQIRHNTITFAEGPAGTGKTYLAMVMAIAALKRHDVSRIVLTRPVVEAGESLGYLPGTLEEKLDPYVRPLYDALFDMTDMERAQELIEQGVIEIAPLAFMRGRTLNDAFVILDEAQNSTAEQMKMFLTRLGFRSKFVITGDVTQKDITGKNGLSSAREVLEGIADIAFCTLTRSDVVRHTLVGDIIDAYDASGGEVGA